jgi:predicted RecA/RadA family phage recombinase
MINFPSNPSVGDDYQFNGRRWKFNGTGWVIQVATEGLADVAYSGSYEDLTDKPTIPEAQVNSDWEATEGVAEILNKPALFSGSYDDLTDKPSFADVALSGSYDDLSDVPTDLVTLAGTQTLTNKVIDDINNSVGADHIHFKVQASEAITKGNVVKVTGYNAGENALRVGKVSAATDVAVGVAHDNIANGDFGAIINTGVLEGINTSGFTAGTILYPNTSGGLTSTAPTSGAYQAIAYVIRVQSNNGAILIEASEPNFTRASANTANTLVQRDGSGNFSANTITINSLVAGNTYTKAEIDALLASGTASGGFDQHFLLMGS